MTEELLEAVKEALNVMGDVHFECTGVHCPGCQYEAQEAQAILTAALAKFEGCECHFCFGERYVPGDEVHFTLCPLCKGFGAGPDYVQPYQRFAKGNLKEES